VAPILVNLTQRNYFTRRHTRRRSNLKVTATPSKRVQKES
jgi:hypothetical protein